MALFLAIGIVLLLSWAAGFALLPQYSPWIHAPLVLAALAFWMLLARRRPRAKSHA